MTELYNILTLALQVVALLISITLHEVAHGYASYKLGDSTAKFYGRLSLNPFAHINPIGFGLLVVIMLLGAFSGGSIGNGFVMSMLTVMVCFSFAKPVPVGTQGLKNPIRDMAIISVAGPVTNLIIAFFSLVAYKYIIVLAQNGISSEYMYRILSLTVEFLLYLTSLNVGLAVFNLVPVPPLDGSKILYAFLPKKILFTFVKYERYIALILVVLLIANVLDRPLAIAGSFIMEKMLYVVDLLPPQVF